MPENKWSTALKNLPLGLLHYFDKVDSTNDIATKLLNEGAPNLSIVLANEQLKGRGRNNRTWVTPKDTALAFSLILRPEREKIPLFSGLGSLAVCKTLQKKYSLPAKVKWPNDVLINGKKVAGILAEAHWLGNQLRGVILGIGINVTPQSVPVDIKLNFPATSVEQELGDEVSRADLLRDVLVELLEWYPRLNTGALLQAWEENLAYKGEIIRLSVGDDSPIRGRILGLNPDASLRLELSPREEKSFQVGEIHRAIAYEVCKYPHLHL